jgi:hypothetical protein
MAFPVIYLGGEIRDSGHDEPAISGAQLWLYDAKVDQISYSYNGAQPTNTPLFNIAATAVVMPSRTFHAAGSTSFPGFERKVWVKVDFYLQFIRDPVWFQSVAVTGYRLTLLRVN